MVKAILGRSSWQFAGLAFGKLLSIGLFILLARVLLPDRFGQLVLFITIIQLVTAVANMGLKPWFQTQAATSDVKQAFQHALSARLLLLGVSLVLVTVYLLIAQPFAPLIGVILVIILIPESLSSLAESYWLQQQRPARVGLKTPIFFLIVGFAWLASNFTTSLMYLSIFWLVASVVTAVWFFPWQSIAWSNISLFQRRTIKSIRGAATYAVIATAGLVYSRADQLIIQWFRGFGALGIYSAAYRLIDSINLLPQAIAENLFPEAAKPGTITLKHLYKIEAVIGVIGAVVALALFVLAEWAVVTLLGTEYLDAIPLIHVFCVLLWLFFINAPLASVIQSSSLVRAFLPFGIANTVLNVLLNLLLVPPFGLVAAAWSMVLTEAIGLLINVYFVRRLYRS